MKIQKLIEKDNHLIYWKEYRREEVNGQKNVKKKIMSKILIHKINKWKQKMIKIIKKKK